MSLGPLGFGPLSAASRLTPDDLAKLYNPRRLPGTGAIDTQDAASDMPPGVAEYLNATGGVAAFGANPPAMLPGATPDDFDQRFNSALPGQGFGLPGGGVDALRAGLLQGEHGPQSVPLPPPRPSAADLGGLSFGPLPTDGPASSPATIRSEKSSMADRGPARSTVPQADWPAPGAVPIAGQMPALSFGQVPGAPASPATLPVPGPVAPAPSTSPAAGEGGFDFGGALDRFAQRGGWDMAGSLGLGLLSARGFGPGIAAGLQLHQKQEAARATTDLARAEYGLKVGKLARETRGENATRAFLVGKGMDANLAEAAMSNPTILGSVMQQLNKDPSRVTIGGNIYELKPGERPGASNLLGSAEASPDQIRARAQASAEGAAAGKPDEPFNLSAGQTRYSADGKPIVQAPDKKPEGFEAEAKLRTEFNKNLGTFQDVHDGYGRVIAATEQREANPKAVSPASDIGLVFGYMKMLDPGSVVREGEYATAANAAGMPERVRNAYNKALSGEFLSREQRQDFIEQADRLYGKARGNAEGVAERYRGLAGQYGVDPGRSVYLPEAYKPPKVGASRTKLPEAGGLPDVGTSRDAGGGITIKRVR